jgi:malate dehydrogenase
LDTGEAGGCRPRRGRIVLAGPSTAAAPLAHDFIARGLEPVEVLGRSPGESSEAAAGRPDRVVPLRAAEDVRGASLVVLAEADGWAAAPFEEMASLVPRLAPRSVVLVTGDRSNSAAARFLRRSRIEPARVVATGGVAAQLVVEGAFAAAAAVSRAQASAILIGREDGALLLHAGGLRVAGIPAALIPAAAPLPAIGEIIGKAAGRAGSEQAAAVLLADAVLHDRRRVLCCGSLSPSGIGLPESVLTMPALVGAGGIIGLLPLRLSLDERLFLNRTRPEDAPSHRPDLAGPAGMTEGRAKDRSPGRPLMG